MTEFPCPFCHVSLRVRDDSFRNRVIACPDCRQDVLIQEGADGLMGVAPPAAPRVTTTTLPSTTRGRWGIPQIAAGVVSLLLIGVLLAVAFSPEQQPPGTAPVIEIVSNEPPPVTPVPVLPEAPPVAELPPDEEDTLPAAQKPLKIIGQLIQDSVNRNQQFPASSTREGAGWSWIAELAERQLPGGITRQRERGWDAAQNDEFVRRPFPEFLNPAITHRAGDDQYPATHYVGISGFGRLTPGGPVPADQAGLFQNDRPLRPDEIPDGLANTMMIAGVTSQLGSWARPGGATTRAFVQEPYINGPDGFGTGEANGMSVLMADGSVRFLNQGMDPEVFRQLVSIQNSKGTAPPPPVAGMVPPPPPEPELPIAVPVAPEPKKIDLTERLKQPLTAFHQMDPVPVEELLFDVQELLGVRIDLSGLPAETRRQPITISLKATTVGDVLKEVAQAAGVGYAVQADRILIQPLGK